MYRLLEDSGFTRVRSAVVPGFHFRKSATQDAAEAYWIQEGARKPTPDIRKRRSPRIHTSII